MVAGYALTFGALMLTGGKLADLFGRRLIFVVGLASSRCRRSPAASPDSANMLIAARVVQGVGAAMMNPATLSIITVTFPPQQRGKAIGIWVGVSALALAIGPLVGGLITEHVNWNWIFFINVPVGIIAIVAAFLFIDESRDTSHEQRPDVPGLLTSAIGLFALSYGLIEANNYGWTLAAHPRRVRDRRRLARRASSCSSGTSGCRCSTSRCSRTARSPGANTVMLMTALAMFGVFFYVSLFMQQVLDYSPVAGGRGVPADDGADHPRRAAGRAGWPTASARARSSAAGSLLVSISLVHLLAALGRARRSGRCCRR